jgi:hypothetical protein
MKLGKKKTPARKYGRLHDDGVVPRAHLRVHEGATLTPSATADWYSAVPANSWLMLANGPDNSISQGYEGCGDCTCAAAGHICDQVAWYAEGSTPAPVTGPATLTMYEGLSGYDPRTGANDNGATCQGALQYWQTHGLAGFKPSGFAQIDVTNVDLVKTVIDVFGCVYTGFDVPAIFETQFDNGQPWDVPKGRSGSQIVGGHAVPLVGYDANYFYCCTWGQIQPITYGAFTKYWAGTQDGEAWAVVVPQLMETSGATPSGLNTAAANADWQSLTGTTASPFPAVTPPVNPPTPPVPPVTTDADATFWAAAQAWALAKGYTTDPHHHGH